jgi:hypothetical protein
MLGLRSLTTQEVVVSQVMQPRIALRARIHTMHVALLAAVLTLAAAAAVVFLVVDDGATARTAPAAVQAQPALRPDGGPQEGAFARSQPVLGSPVPGGPDESSVAASIAGH